MRRNTIHLHQRLTGARFEFLNRVDHKWTPVDGETAGLFVRNVVDYPNLPVGLNPFESVRKGRQKGKSRLVAKGAGA